MFSGFILLCLSEMSSGDVPGILTPLRCESHFPSHPMMLLLIALESVFCFHLALPTRWLPCVLNVVPFLSIFVKGGQEMIFEQLEFCVCSLWLPTS